MLVPIRAVLLLCVLALTACGAAEPTWAPNELVARQRYVHDGPPRLTLFTVINNKSGSGGHSALMVNAPSQRAIFDPAGTFHHPHLPERNDVVFGMSDPAVTFYKDYHARVSWHVVEQSIDVSPQVAELVLAKIQSYGAVPKAQCASSVSNILRTVPGFQSVPRSQFPKRLMAWFEDNGAGPGTRFYDDSPDNNKEPVEVPPLLLRAPDPGL